MEIKSYIAFGFQWVAVMALLSLVLVVHPELPADETIGQWVWFDKAARQGVAVAQQELGSCYANGFGVEKNDTTAMRWFSEAARQGLAEAQFALGACFYEGKGVEKDTDKAFYWYRKAAYQELAEAQYFLGMSYYSGLGVEQDNTQAIKWLEKALENGLDGDRAAVARDMIRRID